MCRMLNIFITICLLVFTFTPGSISACTSSAKGSKIEKFSCNRHKNESSCKKNCCHHKHHGNSGCRGNCGKASCQNSPTTFFINSIFKYSQNVYNFENKNLYSIYKQPYYSSGFDSIWQPPKIA